MAIAFTHEPLFARDDQRRAATVLAVALTAGAFTQALFWRTGVGLNFFVWDLLLLAASVAVFRRGPLRPTAWGAIAASSMLGFSVVRFASTWTLVIAVPANLAILAAVPILVRDGLTLAELARLPWRMVASLGGTPRAVEDAARLPGMAVGGRGRALLRGVTRGLFIGLPTAGLFTLLLSSDADFARAVGRVRDELGEAALFVTFSLVTSAGYLFTHALHAGARAAFTSAGAPFAPPSPYRLGTNDLAEPAPVATGRVGVVTWAMVIGQVALVFAVFVGANLRHLFGGHALVRAPGALTYASYLHAGFAQLLLAAVLSVCLVVAGHALLRPRGSAIGVGDAPVPGGTLLTALEGALLVLTGVTLASCWQRLAIYEDAYGASHLRLGVALIELSILGVLLLTIAKVVFRGWTGHGGAVLALGAAVAVFASGINADGYVALTNLDRAARGKALDVEYLASLSSDARGALDHPVVRADPALGEQLALRYCDAAPQRDFRAMRGLGRCPAPAR